MSKTSKTDILKIPLMSEIICIQECIIFKCFKSTVLENKSTFLVPGRVAQSVGHLTRKSGVLGSIPGLIIYFRFSFRFFKKGSWQLLA